MYDDNTTPRWATLWAHGTGRASGCPGWGFAHVWSASDDINSYTHLANLAMIPECFASLTDKNGPLTGYLRWHAWTVYGWKPDHVDPPQIALGLAEISLAGWTLYSLWRASRRSPFVFTEEDAHLVCQTPVSRAGVVVENGVGYD